MRSLARFACMLVACGVVFASHTAGQVVSVGLAPPGQGPARDPTAGRTQPMPIGTGVIAGSVIAAADGHPLAGASVMLSGSSTVPIGTAPGGNLPVSRTTFTDDQGGFEFDYVPSGRFTVTVTSPQFLTWRYGQKQFGLPAGTLPLSDGQRATLKIALTHAGAIAGTVLSESGDPAASAQVRLYRYAYLNGVRSLTQANATNADDRGSYRVFGLQPGDYLVAATVNLVSLAAQDRSAASNAALEQAVAAAQRTAGGGSLPPVVQVPLPDIAPAPPTSFVPTFYPGVPAPSQAATISIGPGEERLGIDIRVRPVRAGTIQGVVSGFPGPAAAIDVSCLAADPHEYFSSNVRAMPDGKFTIGSVPPGQYVITAVGNPTPAPTIVNGVRMVPAQPVPTTADPLLRLWGRTTVFVQDGAPAVVEIALQPARTISGRVVFDTSRPTDPAVSRVMVSLTASPSGRSTNIGGNVQAQVGPDGRFTLTGVTPNRYVLRSSQFLTRSALVNGEDILDFPLDFTGDADITDAVVTVTDRVSNLSGILSDSGNQPVSDYTILVAPIDSRYWTPGTRRIATARTSSDGHFSFAGLPAGSYFLAALTTLEAGQQFDPDFLKTVAGASVPVTLSEEGRQVQDLRVGDR